MTGSWDPSWKGYEIMIPMQPGKKNFMSLYTYIDALRKYDPQIVLKQW